jgi:hypothetical protein
MLLSIFASEWSAPPPFPIDSKPCAPCGERDGSQDRYRAFIPYHLLVPGAHTTMVLKRALSPTWLCRRSICLKPNNGPNREEKIPA